MRENGTNERAVHAHDFPPGVGRRFALCYGALFVPFAVLTPYLQKLLKLQGFEKDDVGLIQGTMEVLAVLAPPLWGVLSDRTGRPRTVLFITVLGYIPAVALFGWAHGLLVAVPVAVLFAFFFRPGIPLTDGITFRYIHHHGGDYGKVRICGSVVFIATMIAAEAAGIGSSTATILWAVAIAGALHLASVFIIPSDRPASMGSKPQSPRRIEWRVFLSRGFLLFALAALLGRMAMMSYYHFFTLFLEERIGVEQPGLIWLLGPLSEIPVIYFSTPIMRRIGVRNLFALGLAGIVLRLVGYGFARSVWHVAPLQFLHALTFGAYHTASVTFISRLVPAHMKSSAQTIFAALTVGLGGILGGWFGGYIARFHGFPALYWTFGVIAFVALVILLGFVPDDKPRNGPQRSSQ